MEKNEIHLIDRKELSLSGIEDVRGFDEEKIELAVGDDTLFIQGNDLHIQKLSLETGEISICGVITAIFYDEATSSSKKGIFSKLFR